MKKGDVFVGPTPEEILKITVCHKANGKWGDKDYGVLCGSKELPRLSHSEWEKVNCSDCLSLRRKQ